MTKKPDQAAPPPAAPPPAAPPPAAPPPVAPPPVADLGAPGHSSPGLAAPGVAAPALLCAARVCYGGLLLCAPGRIISLGAGHRADPRAAAVARVLGARHLLQAAATAGVLVGVVPLPAVVSGRVQRAGAVTGIARSARLRPGPVVLTGSAVDALHAASMIGLAAVCLRYRRAAMADVLVEAGFAAFGIITARRLPGSSLRS